MEGQSSPGCAMPASVMVCNHTTSLVYSNSVERGSSGSCRRRSSSDGWKTCRPCGERRRGGRQNGSRYWCQCTHTHTRLQHPPAPAPAACLPAPRCPVPFTPQPQIPPIFSSFTLSLCFLLPFNPTLLPALLTLCLHSPSLCPSLAPSWGTVPHGTHMIPPHPVSSYSHLCHIAPWGSSTPVPPHPHPADSFPPFAAAATLLCRLPLSLPRALPPPPRNISVTG